MTHITINLNEDAEKYCKTFPQISEVLGTVIWNDHPGALVCTQVGVYLQVTVGAIYRLPQEVVVKELQEIRNDKPQIDPV